MRRSNRSIEVFDISLMAVVTKAMGAFLVLMLLLMPYYQSGPVGEKNAEDLAKKLEETQSQLSTILKELGQYTEDPRELRRLLEEARRRLTEAQALVARLKRDNDALNSQVRRLEGRLDDVRHQLAQAQEELRKRQALLVSVQLINTDCPDVRLGAALLTKDAYVSLQGEAKTDNDSKTEVRGNKTNNSASKTPEQQKERAEAKRSEPVKLKYILNHAHLSLGNEVVVTDDEIVSKVYDGKQNVRPGQGRRFNSSATTYGLANESDPTMIVVTSRSKRYEKFKNGDGGYALQKTSRPCHALISAQTFDPIKSWFHSFYPFDYVIPAKTYALVLYDMKVIKDKEGNRLLEQTEPSTELKAWLADQIAHAEKVEDKPPTPKPDSADAKKKAEEKMAEKKPRERTKDEKTALLKKIDALTPAKDTPSCIRLTEFVRQIFITDSRSPKLRDTMNAVFISCTTNKFGDALDAVKKAAHENLK